MRAGAAFAAILVAAVALASASVSAQQLSGKYALAGESSAGIAYQGSIAIAPRDRAFDVTWDRAAALERRGFGLRLDNVLGIAAEDHDADFGVVLYRVKGGHLDGIWQGNLSPHVLTLGRETLDGPDALEGSYTISLGLNPDGTHYSGTVQIKKSGELFAVDWYTPGIRYLGTGILIGDIFVVGYGEHHRSGVAAFCLRSSAPSEGITGEADDHARGAEMFWPANATPATARLAKLRSGDAAMDCGGPIAAQPLPSLTQAALR